MGTVDLRQAFESKVAAYAKANGFGVIYENKATGQKGKFLEVYLLPAKNTNSTFCSIQQQGIFQITAHFEKDKATKEPDRVVDELMDLFMVNSDIGQAQIIDPPYRSQGFNTDTHYIIVVSVPYIVV